MADPKVYAKVLSQMISPSQSQVRAVDNAQLDWQARSPDNPFFGDRRDDGHIIGQAHIDHIWQGRTLHYKH